LLLDAPTISCCPVGLLVRSAKVRLLPNPESPRVLIGLAPETLYQMARLASEELLDPSAYVYSVLGSVR